jgi:16S rRNA G966 N2-methylase RsmD
VRSLQASQARLKAAALRVEPADALGWMARCAPASFDLVLLDPPFGAGLQAPALAAAAPLLGPGGLLYLESPAALAPPDMPLEFALLRQGRAGAVHYHLLRRNT